MTKQEDKLDKLGKKEVKHCLKCDNVIKASRRKIFCSDRCAKSFHALKRYKKIRFTSEYRLMRKNYIKAKRKKIKEENKKDTNNKETKKEAKN
jgi:predicted nucleic acid-binding Zn ribbon protein